MFTATIVQRVQEIVIPAAVLRKRRGRRSGRSRRPRQGRDRLQFRGSEVTSRAPTDTAHSAAWLLENGRPIKVVLVGDQPLGKKNADGIEIYALQLTAYEGVDTPYQLTVGNPVPASALPLLFPARSCTPSSETTRTPSSSTAGPGRRPDRRCGRRAEA
ncbi:MAG: hypothetical protein WDM88_05620 [Galbitalea sp.]